MFSFVFFQNEFNFQFLHHHCCSVTWRQRFDTCTSFITLSFFCATKTWYNVLTVDFKTFNFLTAPSQTCSLLPEANSLLFQTLTGAGGVLRIHLRLHVRRPVQRLQVHILRLWQHLQKSRLTIKRVYSLRSQQTHPDPQPAVAEGRPRGQEVRPVRQSLQRPPRRRRRLLVEAEQLLDPEAGAPVHRGGHLPHRRRQLGSRVVHAGLRSRFHFILRVWKHDSLLPRHVCAFSLYSLSIAPLKRVNQTAPFVPV